MSAPARAHPTPLLLACEAMATRFELVLPGEDQPRLRAAGEEALRIIRRLDAQLSCYRPTSDISRINALAAAAPVPVDAGLFELLLRAQRLHELSAGAFDITIGPLMRCWGLAGRSVGTIPDSLAFERARACTGMSLVGLDVRRRTVRFARPGVALDLGAIGKGYALEQAALALRELGVSSALLHGGTSSVTTIGTPPAATAWRVAIEYPHALDGCVGSGPLALVPLADRSLSVSAVWGKAFLAGDVRYGHVLDPRGGRPVQNALLAAAVCDDATAADALSTALLVLGPDGHQPLTDGDPELAALVLAAGAPARTWSRGIAVRPPEFRTVEADVA